jgi:hypothetical protein
MKTMTFALIRVLRSAGSDLKDESGEFPLGHIRGIDQHTRTKAHLLAQLKRASRHAGGSRRWGAGRGRRRRLLLPGQRSG